MLLKSISNNVSSLGAYFKTGFMTYQEPSIFLIGIFISSINEIFREKNKFSRDIIYKTDQTDNTWNTISSCR